MYRSVTNASKLSVVIPFQSLAHAGGSGYRKSLVFKTLPHRGANGAIIVRPRNSTSGLSLS
jgi:hypothetical protein